MNIRNLVLFGTLFLLTACVTPGMSPSIGVRTLGSYTNFHQSLDPVGQLRVSLHEVDGYEQEACQYWTSERAVQTNPEFSSISKRDYNQQRRPVKVLTAHYMQNFDVETDDYGAFNVGIIVPKTFSTDLFSVPEKINGKWYSWIVNPFINLRKEMWETQDAPNAAIVHDWLYATGDQGNQKQRQIADQAMIVLMEEQELRPRTIRRVEYAITHPQNDKTHGQPGELRFYNKCYYDTDYNDVCDLSSSELKSKPVLDLAKTVNLTSEQKSLLYNATICIRPAS